MTIPDFFEKLFINLNTFTYISSFYRMNISLNFVLQMILTFVIAVTPLWWIVRPVFLLVQCQTGKISKPNWKKMSLGIMEPKYRAALKPLNMTARSEGLRSIRLIIYFSIRRIPDEMRQFTGTAVPALSVSVVGKNFHRQTFLHNSDKIDLWFLSNWKEYYRSDSFPFKYKLNGTPFSS